MSLLKEFVNSVNDPIERESIEERIDIVEHKIKFRDAVPVYLHDCTSHNLELLSELIQKAGGNIVNEPSSAKCLIYYNENDNMAELMNFAMQHVQTEWEATQLKQVYLINKTDALPNSKIDLLENIAEIIHPGFFVFGLEGEAWIRFDIVQ